MSTVFPETLGDCIDTLYNNRSKRLEQQKIVDALKKEEAALSNHIIDKFTKTELQGAKGAVATASVKRSTVYQLEDWENFIQYVAENKAWELLRKQPAATSCRERFEAGQEVPGIMPFVKIDLSLTKVGS